MADDEIARRDREIEELRSALASRDRELEEARQQTTEVVDQLAARRTVRRFTDDPVREEDVRRAVACGQRASTSSWILRTRQSASSAYMASSSGIGCEACRCCGSSSTPSGTGTCGSKAGALRQALDPGTGCGTGSGLQ